MKNVLATLTISLIATASAHADTGIEGNYKFTGQECSSGAAPQPTFTGGLTGSYGIDLAVSSSQLTATMSLQYKLDAATGSTYIKQIQDSIAAEQQQPESPEKQKSLAELQKSLDSISQMVAGYSCSEVEVMNYSLSGSNMHTVPVSQTGNCQGQSSAQPNDSTIQISDDVLRASSAQSDNQTTCPKGDNVVSVFHRNN